MTQEQMNPLSDSGARTTQQMKQVCVIHILFPAESDEQAIRVNAAIGEAVKNIAGVKREMRISSGLTSEPRMM